MLTKPVKQHNSRYGRYLCFCLIILNLLSCNWFLEHEYVTAQVVNETGEDISVGTGMTFISVDIMKDQTLSFPVVKGARVSARGNTTGRSYGSHVFSRDWETWTVR